MPALRSLFTYLAPYRRWALLSPLLMILEVAMDLVQPRLIARLIDDGIAAESTSIIRQTGGLMLLAALLGLAGGAISSIYAARATMHFSADLRQSLFSKVQSLSFGNIDRLETGQLITRLTNDVQQVQEIVMMLLRIMVRSPLLLVGSVIMAFATSPRLAMLLLVQLPLVALITVVIFRRAFPRFGIVQKSLDALNVVMQENLAGVRVVRAFSRNEHERTRFGDANTTLARDQVDAIRTTVVAMPAMMVSTTIGTVSAIWFGGHMVNDGSLKLGELIAFNTYMIQAMMGLMFVSMLVVRASRGEASALRLREVLDSEPDLHDPSQPKSLQAPRGRLEFDHVTMKYRFGEDLVLNDVSFVAEPGQTVAILGATGSGKSTLINLIPRFYDVESGAIRIDGVDVRDISQTELRDHIAIALQEAVLFTGTVRDNIRYGVPNASDEVVARAAIAAQADEFIRNLPNGYDSEIGQRGVNLSGGQKQRIAIARALISQPSILILDDSTSAVDVATESRIQRALREFQQTRVIVAQRISSVLDADKIIILEDGRKIAEGTHAELMAGSSEYREIYESQLEQAVVTHGD